MKRVLVTGASGFIGQNCLNPLLERGYEVHAVSLKQREKQESRVVWHKTDLLDLEALQELFAETKPTHLLHLAWCTSHGEYWNSLDNFLWVQSSLALIRDFERFGGQRMVIAGTCAEYDLRFGYCSESLTALVPQTPYGSCKSGLWTLVKAFAKLTGLSVSWGRVFFVYGPHEHPGRFFPSVIRGLLKGETVNLSHCRQIRDYLHVQDVADLFVLILDSLTEGPINIASGQPLVLRETVEKIVNYLGGNDLIRYGAKQVDEDEPAVILADVTHLNKSIGWSARYDLTSGLEDTIDWWKIHLKG